MSNFDNWLVYLLTSGVLTGVLNTGLAFFAKSFFENRLKAHERALAEDSERRLELFRKELSRELGKAQLVDSRTQEVYQEVLRLLRIAERAVGDLWTPDSHQDRSDWALIDLKLFLKKSGLLIGIRRQVLAAFEADPEEGSAALDEVLHAANINAASETLDAAERYMSENGLFLSSEVRDQAFVAGRQLANALFHAKTDTVTVHPEDAPEAFALYEGALKDAGVFLEELEALMRRELHPEQPPTKLSLPRGFLELTNGK